MNIQNVNIMGEGSITGGSYRKVSVMGNGKILGDIEVDNLSVMGELSAEANVKTTKMSVLGTGHFLSVDAKEIGVTGSASYSSFVKAETITVSGEAIFRKSVKVDTLMILGSIEVEDSVEAENFVSKGSFEVGAINANDIKVKLYGSSRADEIGGEKIEVFYPWYKKFFMEVVDTLLFRKSRRASLHAESIEADIIYLENTIAKNVKGSDIRIGPGCRIDRIEYKNNVYIDNGSAVGHTEKY